MSKERTFINQFPAYPEDGESVLGIFFDYGEGSTIVFTFFRYCRPVDGTPNDCWYDVMAEAYCLTPLAWDYLPKYEPTKEDINIYYRVNQMPNPKEKDEQYPSTKRKETE